jgi:hypothetical protein
MTLLPKMPGTLVHRTGNKRRLLFGTNYCVETVNFGDICMIVSYVDEQRLYRAFLLAPKCMGWCNLDRLTEVWAIIGDE